jgi:phosphate transport system substrate-binding protein
VTYSPDGSGTGKTKFKNGNTQFGGSDSLYAPGTEPKDFTYIPLIGGPIAIVFNVDGLKNVNLTPRLLSQIFVGKITMWNDSRIKAVNKVSASKLPNQKIQIVYRSGTSGTTNNFANYLSQTTDENWKANDSWSIASGSTTGTGASGNAGIVSTVKSLKNSIGYVDLADATTAGLPFAAVRNAAGQYLKPTVNNSKIFLSTQKMNSKGVVQFEYEQAVRGGYNLSLLAYGMAPTTSTAATKAKVDATRGYLSYFLNKCAPKEAGKIGYVALAGPLLKTANGLVAKIK